VPLAWRNHQVECAIEEVGRLTDYRRRNSWIACIFAW
jgi:hypothetical protein